MPSSRVSISQHRDTSEVIYLCVIYFLPLFAAKKVAQKPRGDNFRGHPIKFSKTDAFALLLREKVSVF
jgi:hypothetical protein